MDNYLRILEAQLKIKQSKKKDIVEDLVDIKESIIERRKKISIDTSYKEKAVKKLKEA